MFACRLKSGNLLYGRENEMQHDIADIKLHVFAFLCYNSPKDVHMLRFKSLHAAVSRSRKNIATDRKRF